MELKDFIRKALVDLITGVEEAKRELNKQDGSLICPPLGQSRAKALDIPIDAKGRHHQNVEFDIAITVSKEATALGKTTGQAKFIKVLSVSAELDGSLNMTNSTVSRMKFSVPVALECEKL